MGAAARRTGESVWREKRAAPAGAAPSDAAEKSALLRVVAVLIGTLAALLAILAAILLLLLLFATLFFVALLLLLIGVLVSHFLSPFRHTIVRVTRSQPAVPPRCCAAP
ncbi:MAG: hypothetical protein Q8Q79_00150 [Sphingopyxis sp.]|nr:hypothetical protein [Sphingopyxis sp.]